LLVAVPGLGLRPEAWWPTLRRLRHDSGVVTCPGYGVPARRHADVANDRLAPDRLAGAVLTALPPETAAPGRRVVLLGHSASCQVVAHAARLAKGRVAALVLVGPTTDPRRDTWPRMLADWTRTAGHEDPRQVPELVRQYPRTGLLSMTRVMDAARRDDLVRTVAATRLPVLVVRGRDDLICRRDWADRVAAAGAPGSVAATLPAGAHMVPLTHGELVADAVSSWLDPARVGTPTGS
jgi:pimeloyl-ACP methyl ester carboxylesterase